MLTLKIALRNILRNKRRTLLTLLTLLGGFVLACLSIGWSDGTYAYIINMFTKNSLGHIQLHAKGYLDKPSLYKVLNNYEKLGEHIQTVSGVEYYSPRLFSAGLASVGDKTAGVRITGIDPRKEEDTTHFSKKIVKGRMLSNDPSGEVILGIDLAQILKTDIGDSVYIISQAADGSIANDVFKICGLSETGYNFVDKSGFYMHLKDAQELLVFYGRVHEIAIVVDDIKKVDKISEEIKNVIHDDSISVEPWQVFAKPFYQAMKADQQGMWISLLIIILIVAVGVLNTILMSVLERTKEYGLLKAMGTRPFKIFMLIMCEANILSIISIVFGIALGLIINYILSIHGIDMPSAITYGGIKFETMYTEINFRSFYIPAITVLISSNLVSILPGLKAARTDAAKSMRSH